MLSHTHSGAILQDCVVGPTRHYTSFEFLFFAPLVLAAILYTVFVLSHNYHLRLLRNFPDAYVCPKGGPTRASRVPLRVRTLTERSTACCRRAGAVAPLTDVAVRRGAFLHAIANREYSESNSLVF